MTELMPQLACFFCGVDSKVLLYFVVAFAILLVMGAFSFLLWSRGKGDFRRVEGPKYEILDD